MYKIVLYIYIFMYIPCRVWWPHAALFNLFVFQLRHILYMQSYNWIHRLNMELYLQSFFGLHVHSCTHWLRPPTSPRIWVHIWGRYCDPLHKSQLFSALTLRRGISIRVPRPKSNPNPAKQQAAALLSELLRILLSDMPHPFELRRTLLSYAAPSELRRTHIFWALVIHMFIPHCTLEM